VTAKKLVKLVKMAKLPKKKNKKKEKCKAYRKKTLKNQQQPRMLATFNDDDLGDGNNFAGNLLQCCDSWPSQDT